QKRDWWREHLEEVTQITPPSGENSRIIDKGLSELEQTQAATISETESLTELDLGEPLGVTTKAELECLKALGATEVYAKILNGDSDAREAVGAVFHAGQWPPDHVWNRAVETAFEDAHAEGKNGHGRIELNCPLRSSTSRAAQ